MDTRRLLIDGLLQPLTDAGARRCIQRLNELFTTQRSQLNEYSADAALVSAYAAYYMPTNMQKLAFVISQVSTLGIDATAPFEVVDFGCGPGTYGFAAAETTGVENGVFYFVDSSRVMLAQAEKIQQLLYPRMTAVFGSTVPQKQPERLRLAVLGNVINEMEERSYAALFDKLNADVLILIEPGTQASFAGVSAVRTLLLNMGYAIQYPCPSAHACPVAGIDGEWCHQVLKATLSPEIARLGQLAGLDRTVMPFIGHVYTRAPQTVQSAVLYRLKTHSKHALFWEACMATPNGLALKSLELPKKAFSKKEQKALLRINAGQRLAFQIAKELKNGVLRIEVPVFWGEVNGAVDSGG
ncbi:MAG: hypothetical protein JXX29_14680 [Deltaproteobacteria bacterium]|nr:hypothetical protein [Deltaproteobacteria bacterium]MBN2672926.1 hypothetical protein [Deltaproteobacteria bacterium]